MSIKSSLCNIKHYITSVSLFFFILCSQSRLVQVTAFSPQLERLFEETGSLGAVPSLKDNMVLVSAHHASTLQQLQNKEQQVKEGNSVFKLVIKSPRGEFDSKTRMWFMRINKTICFFSFLHIRRF